MNSPLRGELKGGVLPVNEAIAYAIQIGEALQEAHANDVIHRDIKCKNIMVNAKDQIKVMDFGLAKLKGSLKLTQTASTIGTLAYMSPEQIQTSTVDARSDIFSFGVVLYEMLTTRLPFGGDYEAAMMYAILHEEPDPLQKHVPNAPSELLHILNRALEKEPEDRYQSMADLVSELRRLQKQRSGVSRASLAAMPVPPQTPHASGETAASTISPAGERKLPPAVWIAGAVALAAMVTFFAIKFTSNADNFASSFQEMRIKRRSTSGNVWQAEISGDGKYLVQEIREGNNSSLWLRQVEINSNVQIAPPEEVGYGALNFAPDGNQIYYTKMKQNAGSGTLYKIPVLGGDAKRILSGVWDGLTFSPDGSEIAFIRSDRTKAAYQVVIASADGSDERNLVDYPENTPILGPSWSPDGETIAVFQAKMQHVFKVAVLVLDVATGHETTLARTDWKDVSYLAWLTGVIPFEGRQVAYVFKIKRTRSAGVRTAKAFLLQKTTRRSERISGYSRLQAENPFMV